MPEGPATPVFVSVLGTSEPAALFASPRSVRLAPLGRRRLRRERRHYG